VKKTSTSDNWPPVAIFDNYWATTLAFARSLGRRGVPLHLYGRGAGRWSRYCTRRLRCPPVQHAGEFQPWLREKIRSGAIARVAPTTDLIAYYTSNLRAEFPLELQRTIAPLSEIETCLIKTRFSIASAMPGKPGLPTVSVNTLEAALAAAREIGFPLILKPNSHLVVGFKERGRLLLDAADLARHFRPYDVASGQEQLADIYPELRWPLLQRYLSPRDHRVYSVSGIKDADSGVLNACVSYKREQWPPNVGTSTLQVGCEDQRILERGLQVVDRILSRGIFEIELLAEGNELHPIDLNPRAFGFVELDMARGSDLPWLWFQSTVERLAPAPRLVPKAALVARDSMLHLLRPLFLRRRRDRNSPSEERRDTQLPRSTVSMLGHWSDPVPMIASHFHLLRHPRAWLRAQFAAAQS
jgi:predicted ATP-grasp superfamily ATP-dependent carboligase